MRKGDRAVSSGNKLRGTVESELLNLCWGREGDSVQYKYTRTKQGKEIQQHHGVEYKTVGAAGVTTRIGCLCFAAASSLNTHGDDRVISFPKTAIRTLTICVQEQAQGSIKRQVNGDNDQ
jgi:hypothetical protein